MRISGDANRYDHRDGNDDYTQVEDLFRLLDDGHQERPCRNIAEAMTGVRDYIVQS